MGSLARKCNHRSLVHEGHPYRRINPALQSDKFDQMGQYLNKTNTRSKLLACSDTKKVMRSEKKVRPSQLKRDGNIYISTY